MSTFEGTSTRGEKLHSPGASEFSALAGFRLRFTNGGHKIKRIGVLRDEGLLRINFEDNDGNDPIGYFLRYHELRPDQVIRRETLSGHAAEETRLPLRPPRENAIAVLQGFQLSFLDGEDHEITEIEVDLGLDTEAHIVFRDHEDRTAAFQIALQVLWVDRTTISGTGAFGTTYPTTSGVSTPTRPPGTFGLPAVLRAFRFKYTKGDEYSSDDSHYIETINADLGMSDARASGTLLSMNDGDTDDRSVKRVQLVTL